MSGTITIPVDVTNPGQYFACCGLLELAGRLWAGATAAFGTDTFEIDPVEDAATLSTLFEEFRTSELQTGDDSVEEATARDHEDEEGLASPMSLGTPFGLDLDWWADKSLKPWAGSMNAVKIFKAMRSSINLAHPDPLNDTRVVYDDASVPTGSTSKSKKREPFYFDSRRGGSARSLDIGFAPDSFKLTSAACPAVESLCMVGLQRFRPAPTDVPRVFDYWTWRTPLEPILAAAAACGSLPLGRRTRYRFENAFRTDQRKHKGFLPAEQIIEGDAR